MGFFVHPSRDTIIKWLSNIVRDFWEIRSACTYSKSLLWWRRKLGPESILILWISLLSVPSEMTFYQCKPNWSRKAFSFSFCLTDIAASEGKGRGTRRDTVWWQFHSILLRPDTWPQIVCPCTMFYRLQRGFKRVTMLYVHFNKFFITFVNARDWEIYCILCVFVKSLDTFPFKSMRKCVQTFDGSLIKMATSCLCIMALKWILHYE